jgi:hypothetical protein
MTVENSLQQFRVITASQESTKLLKGEQVSGFNRPT